MPTLKNTMFNFPLSTILKGESAIEKLLNIYSFSIVDYVVKHGADLVHDWEECNEEIGRASCRERV